MSETMGSNDEHFMATVSHELRGPLHAILGLSELLVNSDLSTSDSQLAQALYDEASAMRVLVDDVIEYGRFNSTAPTLSDQPFAPRTLVTSIVDRLRHVAEEAGLRLLVEFDSAVPLRVLGDEVRFGQVVHNLVSNAIRYTEVGSVQVILAGDDQTLSLQVRDTGVGMSDEEIDTIFEPFVRAGSRRVRGTGLGLAIVKRIAEVMEGSIAVDSTPGVGSTFLFSIPSRPVIEKSVEPAAITHSADGTILIVEDNEVNRTLAVKQLELIGLGSVTAESGEIALRVLEEIDVDLVLMDWNLPGISGLETAREIRSEGLVDEHIPIIAMTANVLAGDRAACLEAGMNDHLSKPVSLDDMRNMMQRWLSISEPIADAGNANDLDGTLESEAAIRHAIDNLVADLGDVDTVRVVVETYLGELASRARLLANADPASGEEARRAAHTLRSTSALIGADSLARLCLEFEEAEPPDQQLRERLTTEIAAVEEQLSELLRMGIAA